MKKVVYLSVWMLAFIMFIPGLQGQFRYLAAPLAEVSASLASATQVHAMPDPLMATAPTENPGQGEFLVRVYNDNYVFLHMNARGNVSEYFMVQHVPSAINFGSVISVAYRESSDITVTLADNKFYQFFINDSNLNPGKNYAKVSVAGISNFKILNTEGYPVDKLSTHFETIGVGGPGGDCDKQCLSGGCGSSTCNRSVDTGILKLNCSVTCNSGYFACCRDLAIAGCHCIRDCCTK